MFQKKHELNVQTIKKQIRALFLTAWNFPAFGVFWFVFSRIWTEYLNTVRYSISLRNSQQLRWCFFCWSLSNKRATIKKSHHPLNKNWTFSLKISSFLVQSLFFSPSLPSSPMQHARQCFQNIYLAKTFETQLLKILNW